MIPEAGKRFSSVGDATMDAYHLVFFDMLRTIRITQSEIDAEGVRHRLSFLLEYARMHFQSEEILMETVGFPELAAHRALHRDFIRRVHGMEERFLRQPDAEMAGELLEFCERWFLEHIREADQAYESYIHSCDHKERRRLLRRMWASGRLRRRE
jgi:hemerythrin-like metal-binding protein